MSAGDVLRAANMNNLTMIFIFATLLLLIAMVQKLKPTLSISYQINHAPAYVRAKFVAKLLTAATLYIYGLYLYFFTDLSQTSVYSAVALSVSIILYHALKWGLSKI